MRFNNATKDEEARRRRAKQGQSFTQCKDAATRWQERLAQDERDARRLYGLHLNYDDTVSHNCRLLR